MMNANARRCPRSPFVAIVLAADPSSHIAFAAKTTNISLGGCHIASEGQLAAGTTITIELVHKGESFHAVGEIVYSKIGAGMGIRFIRVSQGNREVLVRWIEELQPAEYSLP